MINARMLIGILWFYVIAQIICNMCSGADMYQSTNIIAEENVIEYRETQASDSSGASVPISWAEIPSGIIGFLAKVFLFDYSIFKDENGNPNEFVIFRYLLICIGVIMWLELFLVCRRLIFGGVGTT